MNTSTLIEYMARTANLEPKQAKSALIAFWEAVATTLEKGETMAMANVGRFNIKPTSPRRYTNPKTKEVKMIPSGTRIYFKASKRFKEIFTANKDEE